MNVVLMKEANGSKILLIFFHHPYLRYSTIYTALRDRKYMKLGPFRSENDLKRSKY